MDPELEDPILRSSESEPLIQKYPYPKSIFFICANEFCERFSYYGMRAILSIYLTNVIGYSEDTATTVFHLSIVFTYITPMMGAILADSLLGKFRTILYLSIVYAIGQTLMSITAIPALHFPAESMTLLGLGLIALGTGGIKPCVASFGADQFKIPEQEDQIGTYFSVFYFCINAGSLLSTFMTPIFREDVSCFGQDTCYSLAFGVPAALMIVSLTVFAIGKPWYKISKPSGNVFLEVIKIVSYAIRRKLKSNDKKNHWMDYAEDTYSKNQIDDIKILLQVLWLYLPLPIYWALYDQQGSRWTFQATRMNGKLGVYTIKPDQMQLTNAVLILVFIPLFQKVVYPLLARCRLLKKPLQRMTTGGVLIGVAFIVSALVELKLETTYPVNIGDGESYLQLINMASKNYSGSLLKSGAETLSFNVSGKSQYLVPSPVPAGIYSLSISGTNKTLPGLNLASKNASTVLMFEDKQGLKFVYPKDKNANAQKSAFAQVDKSSDALPYFRIIQYGVWSECNDSTNCNSGKTFYLNRTTSCKENCSYKFDYEPNMTVYSDFRSTPATPVENGKYNLYFGQKLVGDEFQLNMGGSYVLTVIRSDDAKLLGQLNVLTQPNTVHMLWLVPQYAILTAAEVMFSVTIMDFSYGEAPSSMKSVLQACWLLTVAGGNVIIAIVAELHVFDRQWKEFLLFAGLMFADMILFAYMSYVYKPVHSQSTDAKEDRTPFAQSLDSSISSVY